MNSAAKREQASTKALLAKKKKKKGEQDGPAGSDAQYVNMQQAWATKQQLNAGKSAAEPGRRNSVMAYIQNEGCAAAAFSSNPQPVTGALRLKGNGGPASPSLGSADPLTAVQVAENLNVKRDLIAEDARPKPRLATVSDADVNAHVDRLTGMIQNLIMVPSKGSAGVPRASFAPPGSVPSSPSVGHFSVARRNSTLNLAATQLSHAAALVLSPPGSLAPPATSLTPPSDSPWPTSPLIRSVVPKPPPTASELGELLPQASGPRSSSPPSGAQDGERGSMGEAWLQADAAHPPRGTPNTQHRRLVSGMRGGKAQGMGDANTVTGGGGSGAEAPGVSNSNSSSQVMLEGAANSLPGGATGRWAKLVQPPAPRGGGNGVGSGLEAAALALGHPAGDSFERWSSASTPTPSSTAPQPPASPAPSSQELPVPSVPPPSPLPAASLSASQLHMTPYLYPDQALPSPAYRRAAVSVPGGSKPTAPARVIWGGPRNLEVESGSEESDSALSPRRAYSPPAASPNGRAVRKMGVPLSPAVSAQRSSESSASRPLSATPRRVGDLHLTNANSPRSLDGGSGTAQAGRSEGHYGTPHHYLGAPLSPQLSRPPTTNADQGALTVAPRSVSSLSQMAMRRRILQEVHGAAAQGRPLADRDLALGPAGLGGLLLDTAVSNHSSEDDGGLPLWSPSRRLNEHLMTQPQPHSERSRPPTGPGNSSDSEDRSGPLPSASERVQLRVGPSDSSFTSPRGSRLNFSAHLPLPHPPAGASPMSPGLGMGAYQRDVRRTASEAISAGVLADFSFDAPGAPGLSPKSPAPRPASRGGPLQPWSMQQSAAGPGPGGVPDSPKLLKGGRPEAPKSPAAAAIAAALLATTPGQVPRPDAKPPVSTKVMSLIVSSLAGKLKRISLFTNN